MDYADFLATKLSVVRPSGIDVPVTIDGLFPFQRDLVTWALRRGKAALFADTGTGKTRMQLAWAHYVQAATRGRVLILAPLSVARQTAAEGAAIGVAVKRVTDGCECRDPGIYVTNYDRLHRFETLERDVPLVVDAVVLDESSIIKHHNAKTLATLLERFRSTPYRLACSATPSPNDYTELGTHAEYRSAREHDDERHICPLQLGVIRRCVELWSRPDDIVWSPFMGIGSEGVVALEMGRRFIGAELKKSYFDQAVKNLTEAATVKQESLFALT